MTLPKISGPTETSLYSNDVTMPKLPLIPQRPERVHVLVGCSADDAVVGGHDLHRNPVVAAPAESAGEIAEATAHGEPGDTRGRD